MTLRNMQEFFCFCCFLFFQTCILAVKITGSQYNRFPGCKRHFPPIKPYKTRRDRVSTATLIQHSAYHFYLTESSAVPGSVKQACRNRRRTILFIAQGCPAKYTYFESGDGDLQPPPYTDNIALWIYCRHGG